MPIQRPESVAELGELIKQARSLRQGVFPIGGRTTLDVGMQPLKAGFAIDTTALNRVIDYPARDMTITVQSGITIAGLHAQLAKEGQWLPLDVSEPEKATLGGAIALNQSGPHRYGYGTLRDYVIGISFLTDEGVEVKAGGRVVKNVAGYDLMKLQTGALGTLGIVTQVTLKVKPRPESSSAVIFQCDASSLDAFLNQLHASASRPVVVELLNPKAREQLDAFPAPNAGSGWSVAVGFEEKATTVRWQLSTLLSELKSTPPLEVIEVSDSSKLWAAIAGMQTRPESRFIGKESVLSSKLAAYVQEVGSRSPGALIHAHALNGVVWVHSANQIPHRENLTLRRCPAELKSNLGVWGKPASDWDLKRHIKKTLDPDNVFNPGRMFGDL